MYLMLREQTDPLFNYVLWKKQEFKDCLKLVFFINCVLHPIYQYLMYIEQQKGLDENIHDYERRFYGWIL